MKYELKQSIYNTACTCCRWLGTGDIILWPVTLTVCFTVYWTKKSTKFRTVRWREKGETAPDPPQKMAVTLHKFIGWLSFTLAWLTTFTATWSHHVLQSLKSPSEWEEAESPLWAEAQQGSSEASVENSWRSVLFMATQQMCNSRATAPNDLFLWHTKALSSTVWLLADSCCKCRVLSCSSYLPSNSISQTHLKATSSPTAFHCFSCLIFPFVILATSFLLNPLTVSGCRSTKATNKS